MSHFGRRDFLRTAGFGTLSLCLQNCTGFKKEKNRQGGNPPHVLFICVDDLRTELGCYGLDRIHTPHLDRLAAEGCLFTNHFVSVPTCGASRCGLLTGMLPRNREDVSNEAVRHRMAGRPESEVPESAAVKTRVRGR